MSRGLALSLLLLLLGLVSVDAVIEDGNSTEEVQVMTNDGFPLPK